MNYVDILTCDKGKTLEFKRDLSSPKGLLKTLVAFVNTAGGRSIIGEEQNLPAPLVEEIGMRLRFTVYLVEPIPLDKQQIGSRADLTKKTATQQETQHVTPQVALHVTPQVKQLLTATDGEASRAQLMETLELKDRMNFSQNYLEPALADGLLEMTQPDSPRSPTQKYRLTAKGRALLKGDGGHE